MDRVARLPSRDRQDIFSEAAAKLGISPTIIEKDFWVCLTLKLLFERSPFGQSLVFKGGTSLSKVYGLIERFSEDIDLVLDWNLLGFEGKRPGSKAKQDKLNKEINRRAVEFIAGTLCPQLQQLIQSEQFSISAVADAEQPQIINIRYPASFSEAYIRPEVRLEIGPLASWVPSSVHAIRPYASDLLPHLFEAPACSVLTIAAERTFWEKATILHQEAYRNSLLPSRHSRHYYDLYKLSKSHIRDAALSQRSLLRDVVEFKKQFYPSAWARYDLAVPGTFRLLPETPAQVAHLQRDYRAMQVMLFGAVPEFDSILQELKDLESLINAGPRNTPDVVYH